MLESHVSSQAELSEIFGVHRSTVNDWLKVGCPVVRQKFSGTAHRFDTAAVLQWLVDREQAKREAKKARARKPDPREGEDGFVSEAEAERRKAIADAGLKRIALTQAMERVIPKSIMEEILAQELGRFKGNMVALPAKLQPACRRYGVTLGPVAKEFRTLIEDALAEIKTYG